MNLKPLGDRVILKQDEAVEKTAGGIYLSSEQKKEKPCQGEIVAAGEGKRNDKGELNPMPVKVGDHVIYSKYAGNEIEIDGKEYILIKADDIYAVFTK